MPYSTRSVSLAQAPTSALIGPNDTESTRNTSSSSPSLFTPSGPNRLSSQVPTSKRVQNDTIADPVTPDGPARKRRRKKPAREDVGVVIELPHNLGKVRAAAATTTEEVVGAGEQTPSLATKVPKLEEEDGSGAKKPRKKKDKPTKIPYGLSPGISPFQDWPRPTADECEEVYRLLSSVHGEVKAPAGIPAPSLTVSGCGEVPSILDALLRTVLSGATTKGNSAQAFDGLVRTFGVTNQGIGKGSVDWDKVRRASVEEVEQAIKSGGLAGIKSKNIKLILDMVYEQNLKRREGLINAKDKEEQKGSTNLTHAQKYQAAELADDLLSLNHFHCLSKDEAMIEFVKFPGIGVKTAACVVLFCLQRPCFAVDTHVFRLSKWLGWLPQEKKLDEIAAFRHLEVYVPDHLKYALHQLFLQHGKTCPRCRASTGDNSDTACVIDHLVAERTGKRKGKSVFSQTQLLVKEETPDRKLGDSDE